MKLYMHPVSITSRPVRLFIAEHDLPVDEEVVDLFSGAHHQEPFISINPNRMVPVLEDDDFRLTESSAILKYLADRYLLDAYPTDLKHRARVNEVMDWFNTNFYRDYGYGLVYPQIFPHHKRQTEEAHRLTIDWARERVRNWVRILDEYWIGPDRQYLNSPRMTIADYFGICLFTAGEAIRCDFSPYPNVRRWMDTMKGLKSWGRINEVFSGLVESVKDKEFVAI